MKTSTLLKASLALNALFVLGAIGFVAGAICLLLAPAPETPLRLSEIVVPPPAKESPSSRPLSASPPRNRPHDFPATGNNPASPSTKAGAPISPQAEAPAGTAESSPQTDLPSAAELSVDLPGAADPVPQNPGQPGNSFLAGSVRISVAGSYATAEGPALAVDFTPIAPANPNATTPGQETSATANAPGRATEPGEASPENSPAPRPPSNPDIHSPGKPTEAELFRMKWGWDAYDQAQREAAREAGQRPATPAP